MNVQQFSIKQLEVESKHLSDVLRCMLHTVLFNRAFGLVYPKEEIIDTLDFEYVRCDDVTVHQYVEEQIKTFRTTLAEREDRRAQLVLSFFETRSKKAWFRKVEEKICFEQWVFFIILKEDSPVETPEAREKLENELRERIMYIIQTVNEKQNHIPLKFQPTDLIPFPYEITIPSTSENWGVDMMWNLIKSPQPILT
jgi:hypothetical protein